MTDLPDAETACMKCGHALSSPDGCSECPNPAEAAWEAWLDPLSHSVASPGLIDCTHKAFLAGFAAASGPWAEQLEAAKRDGQIEVARAFQAWAATNEIAENIDWKWFGEICRRYSDIYEGAANE